ncbi:MAG: malto-oligosyltrehalose trehalohydrolase [Microvirga sp.]|nr:malto-oligosyltrehalose trehalohydrolase [Microvirga sp.]
MPFGAQIGPDGSARFRLWAPAREAVALVIDGRQESMIAADGGWHERIVEGVGAGTRYQFALEDGLLVPDPASRRQPEDVHGPSEVVDPAAYAWGDASWRGRPWSEAVIYELHVGTFTPEGGFRAIIGKLDHLVALGVTAIQLMPIADFPGGRNWGYDGVCLFAPDASYGRPDELKALVDAAHARGLMVFLDVVYNHFGPDGNYLHAYAPQFFTERRKTPWGAAIDYDGPDSRPVREFMIHNALYWLDEYHFDGLRLDAVHAILDDSETHLLDELAARVRDAFGEERRIHLVLENEENEAHRLERRGDGAPRAYAAQWNDDVHHVLHAAATGEDAGYYADYRGDTEKLARALAEGFAYQGETMDYRGSPRGEPSGHLPPTAFVAFIQNHDQVGNRAFGDRLTATRPAEVVRAVAAIYLLSPQIPMLFMGEEWAAAQPFPFFCDFNAELGEAVRRGRREEFARFPEFRDEAARERIPDPVAETTFRSAKLDWEDLAREPHAGWFDWYRRVLATRRAEITPRLARATGGGGAYRTFGDGAFRVDWRLGDGSRLRLVANLSDAALSDAALADAALADAALADAALADAALADAALADAALADAALADAARDGIDLVADAGRILWSEGRVDAIERSIGPWSVIWSIASADDPNGDERP